MVFLLDGSEYGAEGTLCISAEFSLEVSDDLSGKILHHRSYAGCTWRLLVLTVEKNWEA